MALASGQRAWMVSRLGRMRFGAARLGWAQVDVQLTIAGVNRAANVRLEGLTIRDYLDGQPNIATLRVDGFTPTEGHEIRIGLGSLQSSRLVFAGHIQQATQVYESVPSNIAFDLTCVSYEWLLKRRKVNGRFTNQSATAIVTSIMGDFTFGFTTAHVASGLPVLDEITFTNEDTIDCLDRIARRIGGYWYVDYAKDLHFFTEATGHSHAITDADSKTATGLSIATDLSEVRTRAIVEGGGSSVIAFVEAGDTVIPIVLDEAFWYQEDGGSVLAGPQRITYAGVEDGGGGALIGALLLPTNAPSVVKQIGTGLSAGNYLYAVTFYDGTGETTAGPTAAYTAGTTVTAPASAPTVAKAFGGNLSAGAYKWKCTFEDSAGGETDAGSSESASVTMDTVSPPSSIGAATVFPGGSLDQNADYGFKFTFDFGDGIETTPSPAELFSTTTVNDAVKLTRSGNSEPPAGANRKFYRTEGNGSTYKALPGPSDGFDSDDANFYYNGSSDGTLGSAAPSSNTAAYRKANLSGLPVSLDPNVTTVNIYRTEANGSTYKKAGSVSNGVTTFEDNVADGSLGATLPTVNTAVYQQASLTSIPIGPDGTVGRYLQRTEVDGSQLKRLADIADNATTTYTDSTADGSLGANVPTENTSALTSETGTVNAGSTSLLVTGVGAFREAGGWALVGGQAIRYAGLGASALMGVPASGAGALTSTLNYGTEIIACSLLTGIPAAGEGSIVYNVEAGTPANILVTVNDEAAQTALAARIGGDGIHEEYLQDNRLSETEAAARAKARLLEVKDPLVTVRYETRDMTAKSGREVTFNLTNPPIVGTFKIQSVTLTNFPIAGADGHLTGWRPRRQVVASSRRIRLEALLRKIKAA